MDNYSIKSILECCLFCLEGYSKKQIMEFGFSETITEMSIQLCDFLKAKEITQESRTIKIN